MSAIRFSFLLWALTFRNRSRQPIIQRIYTQILDQLIYTILALLVPQNANDPATYRENYAKLDASDFFKHNFGYNESDGLEHVTNESGSESIGLQSITTILGHLVEKYYKRSTQGTKLTTDRTNTGNNTGEYCDPEYLCIQLGSSWETTRLEIIGKM